MKRIILVVSHIGANGSSLCYSLDKTKRIQWVNDLIIFDHPTKIEDLITSIPHKYSDVIGLYLNEVIYNYQITHKKVYDVCDMIYLIRNPRQALKVQRIDFAPFLVSYYIFRLRRIYEMAKYTKGALFLTWDELISKKGSDFISKSLNLQNFEVEEIKPTKFLLDIPKPLLEKAEKAYELCIYRINKIGQVLKC